MKHETCGIPDTPVGRVGALHTVHERAVPVSGGGSSGAGAPLERNRPIAIARGFRLQWEQAWRTVVSACPAGMVRFSESGGAVLGRCGGERTAEGVVTSMKEAFPGADHSHLHGRPLLEKTRRDPTCSASGEKPLPVPTTEDRRMLLTRYEPWSAMRQIQSEMSRVFDRAVAGAEDGSNVVTSRWTPAVDIKEDTGQFTMTADVPGVEPGDIEVTMENGVLTIKGERKLETRGEGENGYRRVERVYGSFYRRFTLPDTADAEAISASGKHGVLEVVIPKRAALQPKRIAVSH